MTHLVRREVDYGDTDFSPQNEMADIWRSLDVQAQRYSSLEYVLTKQIEEPEIPVPKLWSALAHYELEPTTAPGAVTSSLFANSITAAGREQKLFSKVKGV